MGAVTPLLRAWRPTDASALHDAVAADPSLSRQLGGAELPDVADCADLIATRLAATGPGGHHLAVTVDDVAVGDIGLSALDRVHDTAWVSYWLAPEHRGRGLATRALEAVARWALDDLGLFRLELGHRTNNPASCRVATRAGFVAEGVERAKLRYGSERFDVETHARLATDPRPEVEPLPLRPGVAGGAGRPPHGDGAPGR